MPATQGTGDSHGFKDCHPIVVGQSDEIKHAHLTHSRKMYPILCELTIPKVCACCGVEGSSLKKLKVCTGCRRVKYCGRKCQKLDWKTHKAFCKSVSFHSEGDGEDLMDNVQHMMTWVCDPEWTHGFLYTDGIKETTPLKLEFIALGIPRDVPTRTDHFGHYDSQSVASVFNFLAGRLLDGHDVLPGQAAESSGVRYMIIDLSDEVGRALLEDYATRSDLDANLMLVVPSKMLPYTLPPSITLHKWKDATTLLELALWKSDLGKCGADVIIPGVLPFLSGFEIGKAKGIVVGERELLIKKIQNILMCPGYELAMETGEILIHQQIYNAFHPHPSGKNSMQRGMLIRHLNGVSGDNRAENLAECSVYEAMVHIDDWVTDWTCFLTKEEQQFVRENVDTFRKLYARY